MFVGPHVDGNDPRIPPRCMKGVWKKCQMTDIIMPNNVSSMNNALKSVPSLADAEVSHGDEDDPGTPPKCMEGVSAKSLKCVILIR